jgi:hypothetical protein
MDHAQQMLPSVPHPLFVRTQAQFYVKILLARLTSNNVWEVTLPMALRAPLIDPSIAWMEAVQLNWRLVLPVWYVVPILLLNARMLPVPSLLILAPFLIAHGVFLARAVVVQLT